MNLDKLGKIKLSLLEKPEDPLAKALLVAIDAMELQQKQLEDGWVKLGPEMGANHIISDMHGSTNYQALTSIINSFPDEV